MDIFGIKAKNKEIRELCAEVKSLNTRLKNAEELNVTLRKPIDDHKNRYRIFTVNLVSGSFDVKCRRFDVDANGYTFYEVGQKYIQNYYNSGYVENGYKIGHIPQRHVIKIFEKE